MNKNDKIQKYGDDRRPWSEAFVEYMHKIVMHPNYEGMPSAIDDDGRIRWNAPSNRPPGKWQDLRDRRLVWWKNKAAEVGIQLQGNWISKTAKTIQPFQEKPCQTCGRVMSLNYVYPTKNTVKKINSILHENEQFNSEDYLTIYEIVPILIERAENRGYEVLKKIFPELEKTDETVESFVKTLSEKIVPLEPKGRLSPGSMSNAPDRLDGFHTYNLCCRHKQDTGRFSSNLKTYSDDRRAFEYWCEGDWAAANLLMTSASAGICPECGKEAMITADHIGPISLGFSHRPKFKAMCGSCNSSKGNRLSLQDVNELVTDESRGDKVVSWYIKSLWDACKHKIKTNDDAVKLGRLLRISQHYYLSLLSEIYNLGYPDILLYYLNPEYGEYKIEFSALNKTRFSYKEVIRTKRADTYYQSKACRMIRISFDALDDYMSKEKRNIHLIPEDILAPLHDSVIKSLPDRGDKGELFRTELLEILRNPLDPEERSALLLPFFSGNYKSPVEYSRTYKTIVNYVNSIGEYLAKTF